MTVNHREDLPLPVIDFEKFGDGTTNDDLEIGQSLISACQEVGFAYLINTGISVTEVDEIFSWSNKFFSLSPEIKNLAPHPKEGRNFRGFSGVGVEQVTQKFFDLSHVSEIREQTPDLKESFDLGRQGGHLENIWVPEDYLPGFRDATLAFFHKCRAFQMDKLLKALSLGLGFTHDYLAKYHAKGDNQLRLAHYPAAPANVFSSGKRGRCLAHTDIGTATLCFQDEVSGLEVESPHGSGQYILAPPTRGAVVFNVGDLLMRWSNDILKSTMHRVRAPAGETGIVKERYSIPFFMAPDVGVVIDCLPGCWGQDKPKKYEPITAEDYIVARLNAIYS